MRLGLCFLAFLLALPGAFAFYVWASWENFTFTAPEGIIQEKLSEALPHTISKLDIDLTVKWATADFRDDNSAKVMFDLSAESRGVSADIAGEADTSIRYNDGSFYLSELNPNDVQVVLGEGTQGKIQDFKDKISDRIDESVHRFFQKAENQELHALKDKAFAYVKENATEYATAYIETVPVYSLDRTDPKMLLASMAIEDVAFSEDGVIVTVNPRHPGLLLIFFVFTFSAGLLLLRASRRPRPVEEAGTQENQ